jgi:saccharopine dehydrogenase (NAD+, L-lysine-forming)
MINAVLTRQPAPPFLTADDLTAPGRRLAVVTDVTCDVVSPFHLLPGYRRTTTWAAPVLSGPGADPALGVISLDNLLSLLPVEASAAFSADLLPLRWWP